MEKAIDRLNLPAKDREEMLQATPDEFLPGYEAAIKRYFERIVEGDSNNPQAPRTAPEDDFTCAIRPPHVLARRRALGLVAAGLSATAGLVAWPGAFPALAAPPDRGSDTEKSGSELVTPKTAQATKRGLDFLVSRQHDDGSFGSSGYGPNVAVVSLAGMASLPRAARPAADATAGTWIAASISSSRIPRKAASSMSPRAAATGRCTATASPRCFLPKCYGMTQRPECARS